jgi:hypothetical protein
MPLADPSTVHVQNLETGARAPIVVSHAVLNVMFSKVVAMELSLKVTGILYVRRVQKEHIPIQMRNGMVNFGNNGAKSVYQERLMKRIVPRRA